MNPRLTGYWTTQSELCHDEIEVMHIEQNGRIVHWTPVSCNPLKRLALKLWASEEGEDLYRVKHKPTGEGWLVGLLIEKGNLIICRDDRDPYKEFHFTALPEKNVSEEIKKIIMTAHAKMTSTERIADPVDGGQ